MDIVTNKKGIFMYKCSNMQISPAGYAGCKCHRLHLCLQKLNLNKMRDIRL
jgi:hypothetical protein